MHHIEAPAARDEQRRAGAARENLDAGRRTVARGTDEPHARPGAEQADRLDLAVAGVRHEEHRARARERARAAKARRAHRADRVARRARHAARQRGDVAGGVRDCPDAVVAGVRDVHRGAVG